jgi:hypothetical protein
VTSTGERTSFLLFFQRIDANKPYGCGGIGEQFERIAHLSAPTSTRPAHVVIFERPTGQSIVV